MTRWTPIRICALDMPLCPFLPPWDPQGNRELGKISTPCFENHMPPSYYFLGLCTQGQPGKLFWIWLSHSELGIPWTWGTPWYHGGSIWICLPSFSIIATIPSVGYGPSWLGYAFFWLFSSCIANLDAHFVVWSLTPKREGIQKYSKKHIKLVCPDV